MTERPKSLSERREELIARSTIQREQFAALVTDAWQPGAVSTGKNILMQARQRPLLSGLLATLAFLFFRRHRLFSLVAAAAVGVQTWSRLSPYLLPLLNRVRLLLNKRRLKRP
ncbi:hypothetical protein LJC19_05940 [Oxalobacter sp. OttesenSCG-928-P03]|nr:hypothetical protein [Oxalobacter sp. OttesenSCG-928-P03]